jgi:hypothetical protein
MTHMTHMTDDIEISIETTPKPKPRQIRRRTKTHRRICHMCHKADFRPEYNYSYLTICHLSFRLSSSLNINHSNIINILPLKIVVL